MPSRKKAKGKARKAAKEAKEAEAEGSRAVVEAAANQRQEETLETRMQRLMISNATTKECWHGLVPSSDDVKICEDFINAYIAAFFSVEQVGLAFITAYRATKVEYADVYDSKMDTVISIFLSNGTQRILNGDCGPAQLYAAIAGFFEDTEAVYLRKSQSTPNVSKAFDFCDADDHTLVSFYRKRIPCSCLDKKYKEVKSVKKMGQCYNPGCSHPGRKVERSKMFTCTRCGVANYCSFECQRADWKRHKHSCGNIAEMKAAFKPHQT